MSKFKLTLIAGLIALQSYGAVKPDSVYLCMGRLSHSYHRTQYCKGLKKCSTNLVKVSLQDAIKKYHRTACGYCRNLRVL